MALWTPANRVTAAWWDFTDGTTVTAPSGFISDITDKSGNGLDLTQATVANRPAYIASVINGLSVGRFDGVNDTLRRDIATNLFRNVSGGALLIVRKSTSLAIAKTSLAISTTSSGIGRAQLATGFAVSKNSLAGRRLDAVSSSTVNSSVNASTTDFQIQVGLFDYANSNLTQRINGAVDGQNLSFLTEGSTSDTASARTVIGAAAQLNQFFTGDIVEAIVIHGLPTLEEIEELEGYVAHKLALEGNLPSDHTFKTFAPTWPATVSAILSSTYTPVAEFSAVHGVVLDLSATYSPEAMLVPEGDLTATYSPVMEALALTKEPGGNYTADGFTPDTLHALTDRATSLAAIPVNMFFTIPKDLFLPTGNFAAFPNFNRLSVDTGVYSNNIRFTAPGFTISNTTFRMVHSATAVDVGQVKGQGNVSEYFLGNIDIFVADSTVYDELTDSVKITAKNVSNAWQSNWLCNYNGTQPGKLYVGFEPVPIYDLAVFIDNMAFPGYGSFILSNQFDSLVGSPTSGENNQFVGFILRAAQGKTAGELVDADVVLGILSQGTTARLIANGTVLATFTHSVATDMRELYFEFFPRTDTTLWTADEWNSMPITIADAYAVGYTRDLVYDSYTVFLGDVDVSMTGAVIAVLNDVDYTGIGGAVSGTTDGSYSVQVVCDDYFGEEAIRGSYYLLPGFSLPVPTGELETTYSPTAEFVGSVSHGGYIEGPISIRVITPYEYVAGTITAPITFTVFDSGILEGPIEFTVETNSSVIEGAIVFEVTQVGVIEAPIQFGVFGEQVTFGGEVFIDEVDYSARITGVVKVEGEEGSARIAEFTIIPVDGVINAFAFSGSSIVINYTSTDSGEVVAQRMFTGLVDSVEYDPITRLILFYCTDNLQNKVAELPRETINILTGGRFSTSISGDGIVDNWEYAQETMRPIPASFDAGVYGQLRVTMWNLTSTPKEFDESAILDETLSVDLARRADILNTVNAVYEFRFNRLRERLKSVRWSINPYDWLRSTIPLLAKDTVESALESSGWNVDYANYTPFPEYLYLDSFGNGTTSSSGDIAFISRVLDPENTCMELTASLRLRFAQNVTEAYSMRIQSSQSVEKNGVIATEVTASVSSEWSASEWEADYTLEPTMPVPFAREKVMDYHPDILASTVEDAQEILIDISKTDILRSHRTSKVSIRTLCDPAVDLTWRARVNTGPVVATGKVSQFIHEIDFNNGSATTEIVVSISGHGSVGIAPTETPTVAITKPEIPETDTEGIGFFDPHHLGTYIGAREDSPEYSEEWAGWIVNNRASTALDSFGETLPSVVRTTNPDGSTTYAKVIPAEGEDPTSYTGNWPNPSYVASKAFPTEGFRIILPEVEDSVRESTEVPVDATFEVVIPEDEFVLSA